MYVKMSKFRSAFLIVCSALMLVIPEIVSAQSITGGAAPAMVTGGQGSTYIPMESWIYPALDRLHGMGYIDTAYMGLKPWTRLSVARMLEESADEIQASSDPEARGVYLAVQKEIQPDIDGPTTLMHPDGALETVYTVARGMSGTPLRDSFHLGQTLINDYGRPYEGGFNNYSGFSAHANAGRFSVYYRGEFQHAPSAAGYSASLATTLSNLDEIDITTNPVQDTLPTGPIPAGNKARLMEGYVGYELLNHEISFGKDDHWMGPARGASMLWGNNAENIYDFQINRVEPLYIPGLSRLTGPFRYDFFVGSLKGHTSPNDPWVHVEKISFKPTHSLEFGFSRMVIWGGKGHEPITLHTFLRSFFSLANVTPAIKNSPDDPGARFGTFDFTWRLPYLRHWATLYTDSLVHDDVSPIDAPRRAAYHPGIYLSRLPGLQHLDLRLEAANTDSSAAADREGEGRFFYWENIQRQGPTNKGFLLGDWVGRMGKGGQGWLTWHLSPKDNVALTYRRAKVSPDFVPGGTTLNDFSFSVDKWLKPELEVQGRFQYERWNAPIYMSGGQSDSTTEVRVTWFPPHRDR